MELNLMGSKLAYTPDEAITKYWDRCLGINPRYSICFDCYSHFIIDNSISSCPICGSLYRIYTCKFALFFSTLNIEPIPIKCDYARMAEVIKPLCGECPNKFICFSM